MDDRPDMRASDAERQDVVERLRAAMDDGRLKMDEYVERMGRAYEAVTHGDLVPLCRDLPETTNTPARPAAPAPPRSRHRCRTTAACSPASPPRSRCCGRSGWWRCRSTWWSGSWSAAPPATCSIPGHCGLRARTARRCSLYLPPPPSSAGVAGRTVPRPCPPASPDPGRGAALAQDGRGRAARSAGGAAGGRPPPGWPPGRPGTAIGLVAERTCPRRAAGAAAARASRGSTSAPAPTPADRGRRVGGTKTGLAAAAETPSPRPGKAPRPPRFCFHHRAVIRARCASRLVEENK